MKDVREIKMQLGLLISTLRGATMVAFDGISARLPLTVIDSETGETIPGIGISDHLLMLHDDLETAAIFALVQHSSNRAILVKRVADAVKRYEANE
jgi:hypothetical protein